MNRRIILFCDNEAVCQMVNRSSSQCGKCLILLRKLTLLCLRNNLRIFLKYVAGKTNLRADNLSRIKIQKFKQITPNANEKPDPLPEELWPITKYGQEL